VKFFADGISVVFGVDVLSFLVKNVLSFFADGMSLSIFSHGSKAGLKKDLGVSQDFWLKIVFKFFADGVSLSMFSHDLL